MKIIKEGRKQKGWSIEYTCTGHGNGNGGCGAVLLIEQPDLYKTFTHCRDETDVHVTFTCAGCGVETDLTNTAQPPYSIIGKLPDKKKWLELKA
jgi:hypothetical protein